MAECQMTDPSSYATLTDTGRLRALTSAAVVINSRRSLEDMLTSITEQARLIIGAHLGSTSLTIPGTGEAEGWPQENISVSLSNRYEEWRDYSEPSQGSASYGLICARNETVRMTDEELRSHPVWTGFGREKGRHPPMRGWLAAPLVASDGANLGILQLSDKYEGEFTEEDEDILVQLAQLASLAVEKTQLLDQARQHLEVLRGLNDASVIINSAATVADMLGAVCGAAADLIGAHLAAVCITTTDEREEQLDALHVSDERAEWLDTGAGPLSQGMCEVIASENRSLRLTHDELVAHPAWRDGGADGARPPLRGWMAAPLRTRDGRSLGVLELSDKTSGDFTPADEAVLVQLAQVASVAVEKAHLHETLAEREQRRLHEELLSRTSHDMQTPLATIVGLSELLTEQADDEQREMLQMVRRQSLHLHGLVRQFLDYTRLEAGRDLAVRTRPVDIAAVVSETVDLHRHERDIELEVQDRRAGRADADRLQQIVSNLLSNAVKFTRGPIRVVVRDEGPSVAVDVWDEGDGLPDEELSLVFDRFVRGSNAGGLAGTGLGLYVGRALAWAMGGTLRGSSEVGEGSCFTLLVPAVEDTPGEET
jgi:signal transduction histidine kinase